MSTYQMVSRHVEAARFADRLGFLERGDAILSQYRQYLLDAAFIAFK